MPSRAALTIVILLLVISTGVRAAEPPVTPVKKIVLIAGKKSHGPEGNGIHDYNWSARLLKTALERSSVKEQIHVEIHLNGWPKDEKALEDAATIMIISDGRDGDKYSEALHLESPERIAAVQKLMDNGTGLVLLHFATFAPDQYAKQCFEWAGGYFDWEENGQRKWYSNITTLDNADVKLVTPDHPIARGVKPFRLKEEFYYNIRFDPADKAVIPLLSVPALNGRAENGNTVAWCRERANKGRGFATTCGHFYDNWKNDDFRKLVLNALAWTAHVEVPKEGVTARYYTREEIQAQGEARANNAPGTILFPGKNWTQRKPEELGLSSAKLDELRDLVGGRGCVVRHGCMAYAWGDQQKSSDVASAMKPVISTLMLLAAQEHLIDGPDEPLLRFEPRLGWLNGGKDAAITWRHLASQTSGYGLTEQPGAAYAYNDLALALYYDTLMDKVYRQPGTAVLKSRLAEPLEFQDRCSFEALGANRIQGRLAISVRDFARFGLLWLRGGRWNDRQILEPQSVKIALTGIVSADLPLTGGKEMPMLPGQRSIGGSRNITPVGPGYYSFNWWLNGTDKQGRRLFVDAPPDAFVASGHGGPHVLWVIPSLDLIVSWNDSPINDHDASPGNPKSRCNQAARLIVQAVVEEK